MRFFTLLMLAVLVFPVHALTKVDVFSAEVLLDIEDEDPERKARSEGLQQVIIKASGDKNAVNNEVVQKAIRRNAANYLSQIGYGDQAGNQTLKMVFNPPQIQSLLTQAQIPYWSDERANLAVWIVEEGRYGRDILWEHSGSPFVNQLRYFSSLRGLPILVPVGDFEDVTAISPTDIWGGFLEPLSVASARYPVDAVLVLRVQNLGDRDHIRWTLYDTKPDKLTTMALQPSTGNESGPSAQALESVVDEVANYYAEKSSTKVIGEAAGSVHVEFTGIDDARTFFTLEKKMKQLQTVATVDAEKVVGDKVSFSVHLLASDAEFEAEILQALPVLKVDPKFVEEAPELDVNNSDAVAFDESGNTTEDAAIIDEKSVEGAETITDGAVEVTPEQLPVIVENDDTQTEAVQTEEAMQAGEATQEPEKLLQFEWIG